jgi:tRNA nucleotidyltransferase/poly(A) polymerase
LPKDLDIATSAHPDVVESSFEHTIAVGKAFGTIVVVAGGENFEITTFRKDGPYLDGRHPASVEFSDLQEDARRRDFTVNAMFYDPLVEELHDYVGGVADLNAKVLRTVGSAFERFTEDRLRLVRAVRFQAQLGFAIEEKTWKAISELSSQIAGISVERIAAEMKRLLVSPHMIEALDRLEVSGLSKVVWPEIQGFKSEELRTYLPLKDWRNVYAAIVWLKDISNAEERLRHWKTSRADIQNVQSQLAGLDVLINPTARLAEKVQVLGSEESSEILLLARPIVNGELLQSWIDVYLRVAGADGKLPEPLLRGGDLSTAGVPPGREMGALLKGAYLEQLEGRLTTRTQALQWIKATLSNS